ncbi:putative amino acid transporter [Sulfolobales Beppu rod-shaped virus 1]|uniref:Putative amino acid transporter n=1 Tax=Sulfolobales Beppu rod-shaped virus 1 TaxID=2493121 RepID=A0A3Q8Q3W1_9VIRU|nr:putative amino acid transporter [Sulfolobales Beppu rod-shaped virus 1]AZI75898.1 putative amino acid transporter [Sulfolobales Beppu rod-shaped virus 1]
MVDKEFTRKSSGIIKSLSAKDFFNLNLLYMGITSGASYPLLIYLSLPSANAFLSVLISILLNLPLLIMYYYLTLKFPQNGGDYNYILKAFNQKIASIFGITILLVYAFSQPILSSLELSLGLDLKNVQFWMTEIVIIVGLLIVLNRQVFRYMLSLFTILQLVQVGIILYVLLIAHSFSNLVNFSLRSAMSLAIIYSFSTFMFINSPSYLAGESKNAKKSFLWGYFGAYFIVGMLIALISLLSPSNIYFIALINSVLHSYKVLIIINMIASTTWYFSYLLINQTIVSRLIQQMSFDNILHSMFTNMKYVLFLLMLPIVTVLNFIENYLGITVNFATDGLFFLILNYLIVSLSALKLSNVLTSDAKKIKIFSVLTIISIIFQSAYYEIFLRFSTQNIWIIFIFPVIALIYTMLKR